MRIGLLFVLSLPLAALLSGCTTAPFCDELTKCGGDFLAGSKPLGAGVGTAWAANSADACIDQIPSPPSPPSLSLIPARPAGVRAVEPSTTEWCAGLVIQNDGTVKNFDDGWYETLKQYRGWFPSVPLYTARLEIYDNNEHVLEAKQLVRQHYELSPTCMHAQGVVLTCDKFSEELTKYIQKSLDDFQGGLTGLIYDSSCKATSEGGCNCDYNLELTTHTNGPWAIGSGQITFFDNESAPPSQTDYCVSGGRLQLSGTNGTDLFNRGSLKTLKLSPTQ